MGNMSTTDRLRLGALVIALMLGSYLFGTQANDDAARGCTQANLTLTLEGLPPVDCG